MSRPTLVEVDLVSQDGSMYKPVMDFGSILCPLGQVKDHEVNDEGLGTDEFEDNSVSIHASK
ncbi:hypothetical protein F1880_007935 [Penicillium rolfsii]|nr:hypothetical protein F1880_007935 [Penicillium rolfsii]